jgi:hypothetical protein
MAKSVLVKRGNETFSFSPHKVERARLYGSRKRVPIDQAGSICQRALLTADGAQMLVSGMISQAYFTTDDRWVPRSDMVGLDADGNRVDVKPSTLGHAQDLEGSIEPEDMLYLQVESVYFLEPEDCNAGFLDELKSGTIYRFPFNYAAGLAVETAYLFANEEGVFAVVGQPAAVTWVEEGQVFVPAALEEEDTDDLDFEAL